MTRLEGAEISVYETVTILYTHNIQGDLDMLPRLYSFIRRLRGELAEGRVFLVDLGASCVPEVWPCAITEGRSTLLVLDAMGFHAANVEGLLTPISRTKLRGHIGLALVDLAHPHNEEKIDFMTQVNQPQPDGQLTVCLAPADQTVLGNRVLHLRGIEGRQVGLARIDQQKLSYQVHDLPPGTPPEPTISGAVDFVREEARYYEKRQQDE